MRIAPRAQNLQASHAKPLSRLEATLAGLTGCEKEGHPVVESSLALESNRGEPQQAQRYTAFSWRFQYSPVKAGSVPFSLHT
jgi:hypothetical protein